MVTNARTHQASGRSPFAPISITETIFRHKKKCLLTMLLVLVLMTAFMIYRKRDYASSAKLFVRIGRETVTVDPTAAAAGQVITLYQTQDREISSVLDLLESRGLAEAVVDTLGPEEVLNPFTDGKTDKGWLTKLIMQAQNQAIEWGLTQPTSLREDAVKELDKSLDIDSNRTSSIISIQCKGPSPPAARRLLATFLNEFQKQHQKATQATGSFEFFERQVGLLRSQLDEASEELRDAKIDANLVSIDAKRQILENQLSTIESSLMASNADLAASVARISDIEARLETTPQRIITEETKGLPNLARDDMRKQLFALQIQEAELHSQYSEDNPLVVNIREQVRQAKEILDIEEQETQATEDANPTYQQLHLSLLLERASEQAFRARIEELQNQQTVVLEKIRALNEDEVAIVDLERKVSLLDQNYRRHVDSLEQSRIGRGLKSDRISNVNVVEGPTLIERPVDLGTLELMVICFVLMLSSGVGIAIISDAFSDRLRSAGDVEASLGLPVLATLSRLRAPHVRVVKSHGRKAIKEKVSL